MYDCEVLEYVFDHQGLNRDDGILPKIEDKNDNMSYHLSLSKFTALEHIKELYIINCGKSLDEKVSFLPCFFLFFLMPFEIFRDIYQKNLHILKKSMRRGH